MPVANVFLHVIPALLTLTSFLLSLLTLLAPTPILPVEVSLLWLRPLPQNAKTGVASLSSRFFDDDFQVPGRLMGSAWRRSVSVEGREETSAAVEDLQRRASGTPAVFAQQEEAPTGLWIGPLGSCSRPSGGEVNCTDPTMVPDFQASYALISLSPSEAATLPSELPMAASSLVASIVFSFLSLVLLVSSSLPYHLPNKAGNELLAFFFNNHRHMAKLACLFGVTSLGVGVISTVSLRITLGNAVVAFNVIAGSSGLQANLGSAFAQLWASWIILGIGCLVAIAMCGRENLALSSKA